MHSNSLRQLGFWSSVLTAACSSLFSISGILALLKFISYPVDPILPDVASLILAIAFMVMMVSVHYTAPQERRHWSHMGILLATLYAALVSIVYFVTVTVVVPLTLRGEADKVALFVFDQSGSFMQAVDGLGYFFMSLATWFAAPVFRAQGLEKWIRRAFIVNGVLGIFILLAYMPLIIPPPYSFVFYGFGFFWILSVPALAILVARYFYKSKTPEQAYSSVEVPINKPT